MDGLLAAANWIGSALCHQWDSHSYIINGVPLCLCARCTGMYLGALLTLGYLLIRTHGIVQMPRAPYLFAFVLFFAVWAGDGANSYVSALQGAPFLYTPQNWIRLTTGMLMGIGLGSLVYVILNLLLKPIHKSTAIPPLYARPRDFWILLALAAILVLIVASRWSELLYPLTFFLLVAMLVVNTAFWLGILSALATQPSQPAVFRRNVLIAFAVTLLILNLMAYARTLMSFPPEPLI